MWSVGCIMAETLSKEPLFNGKTKVEQLDKGRYLKCKSPHPPLKSPMAGTLYRSPAPGEPPFVQVGFRVQKGQVLCIIEAMKLMNEIEIWSWHTPSPKS